MIDLDAFINEFKGRGDVGDTPANTGQCVGLIEVYTDRLGEPHTWGDAKDLLANADPSAFDVTYNTPTNYPSRGDIICWEGGWEGSQYGHTAIVLSADVNTVTAFEQNDRLGGGDGTCRIYSFDYTGVQGWMRPRVLDQTPAQTPPAPAVESAPTPPATPGDSQPDTVPSPPSPPAPAASPSASPAPIAASTPLPSPPALPQTIPLPPPILPSSSSSSPSVIDQDNATKPGYKTTEFWVTLYMAVAPIVQKYLGFDLPPVATATIYIAAGLSVALYIWGRVKVKTN